MRSELQLSERATGQQTTLELLQAYLNSRGTNESEEALRRLMDAHQPTLWNLVGRICPNAADIEEIINTTWLRAVTKFDSLKETLKFESWLRQIARNETIRFLRNEEKRRRHISSLNSAPSDTQSQDVRDENLRPDEVAQLNDFHVALSMLSQNDQKLLMLAYKGLTLSEISEATGFSKETVATLMSRARKHAQEKFKKISR